MSVCQNVQNAVKLNGKVWDMVTEYVVTVDMLTTLNQKKIFVNEFTENQKMKTFETNCIVVTEMARLKKQSYFDKFGEDYWNDTEDIICIPLQKMDGNEISELETFFSGMNFSKAQYLVIEL